MTRASQHELHIDYFNDFPLTLQGAESIHVYEICEKLQSLNTAVRLFTPTLPKHLRPNFEVISVRTPPFLRSVFYQFLVIPKIISRWEKLKPDAVYLRITPVMLIPVLFAKLYRIPIFPEINGTVGPELAKANTRLGKILLFFHISDIVESFAYSNARIVFTVTDALKEHLIKTFQVPPEKIIVVENGVDSDHLKPLPISRNAHSLTVGYVGGLMWWQGLEFLVEAMSIAAAVNPMIRLSIIGDGPERARLEDQVAALDITDIVDFTGKISHDDVNEAINSFDICIAYYVKARSGLNSPFKVYEYLSCSKAVIVSDIRGIGDVFGEVAKVVKAEDSKALAAAIIELASDERKRKELSSSGRAFILAGHTWKDTATQLMHAIQQNI